MRTLVRMKKRRAHVLFEPDLYAALLRAARAEDRTFTAEIRKRLRLSLARASRARAQQSVPQHEAAPEAGTPGSREARPKEKVYEPARGTPRPAILSNDS
jgi:hypothetical protein